MKLPKPDRPGYVITLAAKPWTTGEDVDMRGIRVLLKRLKRRFGLVCLEIRRLADD